MSDNDDIRNKLLTASTDAISNIIYTVVFDLSNEIIISSGADQEKILEIANQVVNKYVEGGIKIRKRPVAKPRVTKQPNKDKPIDTLTAASRKMKSLYDNVVWIAHPDDNNYSYTLNIKLATGYPVRNNETNKIEYVATDETNAPLTIQDARLAASFGLDVEFSSIKSN